MKKKFIAILCIAALVLSLAACKENSGEKISEKSEEPESKYNLDYESEEVQNMSAERASEDVLKDAAKNWLGGTTIFIPGMNPEAEYTYEDFVKKIGLDATTYNKYVDKYSDSGKFRRQYTWIVADNDTKKFSAFFEERDGKWLLYGVGSANL